MMISNITITRRFKDHLDEFEVVEAALSEKGMIGHD